MHTTHTTRLLVTCLALASLRLSADTVDVKNSARIIGTITKIDAGSVVVSTDYAGTITIKHAEVASISTDAPVAIRLSSGTRVDGRVSGGGGGALQIAGAEGTMTTTVDKVTGSWAAGAADPALVRDWAFEAAVDIAGKTGTRSRSPRASRFVQRLPGRRTRCSSTRGMTGRFLTA